MGFRELIGEVDGRKVIDIVNVTLGGGKEVYGRLNATSTKEIEVGAILIKVENIIKIEKQNG